MRCVNVNVRNAFKHVLQIAKSIVLKFILKEGVSHVGNGGYHNVNVYNIFKYTTLCISNYMLQQRNIFRNILEADMIDIDQN